MKYLFFVLLSLCFTNAFAQITVSLDSISFPQTFTGTTDSFFVYIKNDGEQAADIRISTLKSVYKMSDILLTILSNDSNLVWIKYSPNQNVIDRDLLLITSNDSTIGAVISLNGSGKFGDNYDATTFNLYDTQLKTALTHLVSGHTSLGYNIARDSMYMGVDNKKVNGQGALQNTIEGVYTGRLAIGYADRTDAFNNFSFNTEHTWPQSNFNQDEPMRSDLFHLYPTDVTANSIRSNFQFGWAISNITWESAGSKLGTDSLGQIVFEPRDVHKGDVSRSMFYFITRYPINYGGFFTAVQENVFREWNKLDPVGAIESVRNNAIALIQLKRNPFIDHPEFADRIYSFATSNVRPVIAALNVLPLKVEFDSILVGNQNSKKIYIANSGSTQLIVDSITVSDPSFSLNINSIAIGPFSSKKILIQFNPNIIKNYNALLTVYSNGGVKQVAVTGVGKDNPVNVEERLITPLVFTLEQNYPNPFNPGTRISWQSPVSSWQTLKVYDVLGNEITTLVDDSKPAGSYEVEFNVVQFRAMGSGVYFYQLKAGSFVQTRKMILLK